MHFPENYLTINKISTDFLYSISPDKQRRVCQMTYGMILEFFSIKKDRIITDTIRGFIKPIFELDKHKCVNPIDGQTIYGLRDLYATDKYIYTIYIGNTVYKNSNQIAIFDWNGNPLHLFTTNYTLERLCVDEANWKIYATGVSPQHENVLLQFPLQPHLSKVNYKKQTVPGNQSYPDTVYPDCKKTDLKPFVTKRLASSGSFLLSIYNQLLISSTISFPTRKNGKISARHIDRFPQ